MEDRPNYTIEEYVDLEEYSNLRHEFYDGQIWAMAGGTPNHARLAAAVSFQLQRQLQGRPCAVYSSDARVRVKATGLDTYPDLTIGCGPMEVDVEDKDAQTNPTALVEITSETTEKYDRGGKFAHYKRIESLQEYVIVSHREPEIEVHRRGSDGAWKLAVTGKSGDKVMLTSIGCELDVETIYRDPRAVVS